MNIDINEWLLGHPLISLSSIEKICGITHGTLRKDKPIPEKYITIISNILKEYGLTNCDSDNDKPTVSITETKSSYVIRKGIIGSINKEGWFIRISLPDDTILYTIE